MLQYKNIPLLDELCFIVIHIELTRFKGNQVKLKFGYHMKYFLFLADRGKFSWIGQKQHAGGWPVNSFLRTGLVGRARLSWW